MRTYSGALAFRSSFSRSVHERLLAFVWGNQTLETDVDQLKVHVRHLREKLERNPSAPEYVLTVRG